MGKLGAALLYKKSWGYSLLSITPCRGPLLHGVPVQKSASSNRSQLKEDIKKKRLVQSQYYFITYLFDTPGSEPTA